jgi:Kelch motif
MAAERALPPGAVRRRALFGLVDADGWTWAGLKATFWFVVMLFLLGYLPDRAYSFTVFPTIDVGANIISPVNFCDPSNRTLPCPAPAGAVVPWDESPSELRLPQPRTAAGTVQSGNNLYIVGGQAPDAATDSVLVTQATTTGNFAAWTDGPALPQPRADAAVVSFAGIPYVIGGLDAAGQPTDTVFVGTVEEGLLKGWEESADLKLPRPLSGAGAAAAANGIWLVGGRDASGPVTGVSVAELDTSTSPPALAAWRDVSELPLPEARADAGVLIVGEFLYVIGGEGPSGVTNSLMRLRMDDEGNPAPDPNAGVPGWATSTGGQSLPAPRADAASFTANSTIYVAGGRDASGAPTSTFYWAVPRGATGDVPEWRQLAETDLPRARAAPAISVVGSYVFLVGGGTDQGATDTSLRASLAPKPPFFRLGLLGATLPALSIKGEIGQQLGYINAFGVGMTNFVILVLLGWAFSHRRQTQHFLERVTRGRYRAPREPLYHDPAGPRDQYSR